MAKKEVPAAEKKTAVQEEKVRALEAARLQIEKQFGKGSLMKLGENTGRVDVDVIPSGSVLLDAALGIGGYPRGRPPSRCTQSPSRRSRGESPRSWTRSTRWIRSMPRILV